MNKQTLRKWLAVAPQPSSPFTLQLNQDKLQRKNITANKRPQRNTLRNVALTLHIKKSAPQASQHHYVTTAP